jgi:hypothetical protein
MSTYWIAPLVHFEHLSTLRNIWNCVERKSVWSSWSKHREHVIWLGYWSIDWQSPDMNRTAARMVLSRSTVTAERVIDSSNNKAMHRLLNQTPPLHNILRLADLNLTHNGRATRVNPGCALSGLTAESQQVWRGTVPMVTDCPGPTCRQQYHRRWQVSRFFFFVNPLDPFTQGCLGWSLCGGNQPPVGGHGAWPVALTWTHHRWGYIRLG